jgi:hypothetical protein
MRLQTPMLTALLTLSALPVTMSASQSSGPATTLVRPSPTPTWAPDKKNPYSKLFTPTRQVVVQALPATLPPGIAGKPEIKCGMTMIPADPNIDPRMAVSPPADGTSFTIRAIEPPICR